MFSERTIRFLLKLSFILFLNVFCEVLSQEYGTTLTLKQGLVIGRILKTYNGRDFYAFRGIPYATPPIGLLRFKVLFDGWFMNVTLSGATQGWLLAGCTREPSSPEEGLELQTDLSRDNHPHTQSLLGKNQSLHFKVQLFKAPFGYRKLSSPPSITIVAAFVVTFLPENSS
ncbi:esterase FE4 [Trichonephila clavipes]|nr:esterase FE4 [Trichonephila clavipes]